jgi:hypothetical protein
MVNVLLFHSPPPVNGSIVIGARFAAADSGSPDLVACALDSHSHADERAGKAKPAVRHGLGISMDRSFHGLT